MHVASVLVTFGLLFVACNGTADIFVRFFYEIKDQQHFPAIYEEDVCPVLANLGADWWKRQSFSNCRFDGLLEIYNDMYDMQIRMAIIKQTFKWMLSPTSDIAAEWLVNVLLNEHETSCKTAVTFEAINDVHESPESATGFFKGTYTLVAPISRDLCQKIIGSRIYAKSDLSVRSCKLVEDLGTFNRWYRLGKYQLDMNMEKIFNDTHYYEDTQMVFLNELSKLEGKCVYNGYWAKLPATEAITIRYLVGIPSGDYVQQFEQGLACSWFKNGAHYYWFRGILSACRFHSIVDTLDNLADLKLTAIMNKKAFKQEYRTESDVAAAWKLNLRVNGDKKYCRTTVTFGTEKMARRPAQLVDGIFKKTYMLIAEVSPTLCTELAGKKYAGGHFYVRTCRLSERYGTIDGKIHVAGYQLDVDVDSSVNKDMQLKFILEISKPQRTCKYNGYWMN